MTRTLAPPPTPAPAALDGPAAALPAAAALDGLLHANFARLSGGLSPISLALATTDWAMHLATQPAQTAELGLRAWQMGVQASIDATRGSHGTGEVSERPDDHRFADPAWQTGPPAWSAHTYLAAEKWWHEAVQRRGMTRHHRDVVGRVARQWLDMLSPANAGLANPEVLARTLERHGGNLVDGFANALDNWRRQHGLAPLGEPGPRFDPGVEVAVTPGQVVHRNHLVELIQYSPVTARVQAEPVFIVPSWIMKYYILDLSPHNSMVRWLVGQGHTVFIVSWRNPDEDDALLSMDDYLQLGVFDPLQAIGRRAPGRAVHLAGYCLGGTLATIAAAALARPGGVAEAGCLPPLASLSLLAAEVDFSEPGEMGDLIDDSQVALLEEMMAERGFLSGQQMAASFQFLHSRELIWSAALRELWMGEKLRPIDLMAWNADVTRMPALMHSQYLRRCYLHNELAQARYPVEGRPVSLDDIDWPVFLVGTEKDHVAPWRSVYKLHRLTDAEITFVLCNGGHNAGIVSEPGHPGRRWRQHCRPPGGAWLPPDAWCAASVEHEGSWWTAWDAWLRAKGSGRQVPARRIVPADALAAAPGNYVKVRYAD